MKIKLLITAALWIMLMASYGHQQNKNNRKLHVISDVNTYHLQVKQDSANMLVDLEKYIPGILLDIRYAGTNNFTGQKIYNQPRAYVRKQVANALYNIQADLKKMGLGLKVFDAYRPYSATVKFYEVYPDTNFVAAPWKGSVHNRGCAVDVTLVDLKTGQQLEMPTPFDDFTEKASHSYNDLSEIVIKHREILKLMMIVHGFGIYEAEWWHYDFEGWEKYDLMDISFEELEN